MPSREFCKTSPLYACWRNLIQRCTNPKNPGYRRYGGRGVTVCDRWRYGEGGKTGFECFQQDVEASFVPGATFDRKNNNGNYEPGNVRWSSRLEQQNNRHDNIRVSFMGHTYALNTAIRVASALVKLSVKTLQSRVHTYRRERGMEAQAAFDLAIAQPKEQGRRTDRIGYDTKQVR